MKPHKLKRKSSFIVVVLRSLRHGACVCCGEPIHTEKESAEHWLKALEEARVNPQQMKMEIPE